MVYVTGRDLKIWRSYNNLSFRDAADILNINKDKIVRLEKKQYDKLDIEVINAINNSNNYGTTLNVPVSYIDAFNHLEYQGRV